MNSNHGPNEADRGSVAVLGAGGLMGQAMAANLARAGFDVRAWNRSAGKADPLVAHGARIAATPAEAAADAGVVLTMLADIHAVIAAMDVGTDRALAQMQPDAIWLQMSTIGENGTSECIQAARRAGVTFVDAPVLGSRQPAEQGKLTVLGSGPAEVRPRVQPILDVVGERTIWLGEAGAGSRLKLVVNAWVLTVVEAAAEIIALAESFRLDPRLLFDAIEGGGLDLPYLRMKGMAMIERNFTPAFRLALAAKDAALVDDAAKRHDLDLPMLKAISDRLAEGAKDHPDDDMTATYRIACKRSGATSPAD